jgi:hypothetical protein
MASQMSSHSFPSKYRSRISVRSVESKHFARKSGFSCFYNNKREDHLPPRR